MQDSFSHTMAPPQNVFFIVYYNGEVLRNELGVFFESSEKFGFNMSVKSTFTHLKRRIEEKLKLGDNKVITGIYYRNPALFGGGRVHFEDTKIIDNDDVKNMFAVHLNFQIAKSIELNVIIEDGVPLSNIIQQLTPSQQFLTKQYRNEPHFTRQPRHTPQPRQEYEPSSSQPYAYTQTSAPQYTHAPQPPPSNQIPPELFLFQFEDMSTNPYEEVEDESEEDESLRLDEEEEEGEEEEEEEVEEEDDEEGEDDVWDNILHQTQSTQHATNPVRAAYCPPLHMRDVDMSLVERPMDMDGPIPLPVDRGIEEGMLFHNKEDCVLAIRHYHIKRSLDYDVKKSDHSRYVIKCTNSACIFKLRASFGKRSGRWKIVTMIGPHSCSSTSMSQDHRKLDYNVISESIKSLMHKDASIKPSLIIAHIREKFNYTISYRKAWMAKNKAVESIYGNWEKSYKDLPQWLNVMQTSNPGTIVDLDTIPNPNGTIRFHRLFWAFHPCIQGFKYCKPVIHVDGTWLYGKYKGTLLIAAAQDGNNKTIPIAFALVEGETKDGWGFFLRNLRRHVTPQRGVCVISDRHESIKSAYNNPLNGWHESGSVHVYCIRHITQNFLRAIKDRELKKAVSNMGKLFFFFT